MFQEGRAAYKDVFSYASPRLCDKDKEHFLIILLDSKNKVIKDEIVSIGTVSSALAHPREIFKSAIRDLVRTWERRMAAMQPCSIGKARRLCLCHRS
ncbi:MAG TPA: JAB domain-containing protein [Nanoarchaeota archaeon]|nr:JAB domain-containing protein [Nanoarchaeota archaeon]